MANGISNTGNPLYSGYATAQDAFNETGSGNLNLDLSSQYNTGVLNTIPTQPLISIPSGIGTYNVASAQFQDLGGPDLQTRTAPSFSPSTSPAAGGGFGQNFAANMSSPQAMSGVASGIGGIIQGLVGRGRRRDAQAAAQEEYDKMRRQYMDLDTSNIYANV